MEFIHDNVKKDFDIMTAAAGISLAELARRMGDSPQGFNNKITRGKLQRDLEYITTAADACGFDCIIEFKER